jgi:hypothetical protein
MSDGLFYLDTREPNLTADITAVTLASTYKALYPVSNFPVLGGHYFARPGKGMNIKLFGRITTAVTPGNFQIAVFYGTGADANGVKVVETTATALTASQTNLSWEAEFDIICRSIGSAGTLFGTGRCLIAEGALAAHLLAPGTAPAVSAACDLTASLILSVQALRSGSTAETMQVHMLRITSLN